MFPTNLELIGEKINIREQRNGYARLLECKVAALEAEKQKMKAMINRFIFPADAPALPYNEAFKCIRGRQFVKVDRAPRAGDVVAFEETFTSDIKVGEFYNVVPNRKANVILTEGGELMPLDSFTLLRRTKGLAVYAPMPREKRVNVTKVAAEIVNAQTTQAPSNEVALV